MGYQYRYEKNGEATNCFPVDTSTELWIEMHGDKSILDLFERAKEKWPNKDFSEITMDVVNHHQYSIYYDLYDNSDYVQYLVLCVDE